jgi:hypothetical protein
VFADLARGDYRLAASFAPPATVAIPAFSWAAAPTRPAVPAGRTDMSVAYDHLGAVRSGPQAPGAFAAPGSTVPTDPPPPSEPPADTLRPQVLALVVPGPAAYRPGTVLTFVFRFSEPVVVTGRPRLPLAVGTVGQRAEYVSGSGTDRLVFRWTVPAGLSAPAGIRVARQITLPAGAAIADLAGNAALPAFTPPTTTGIRILPRRR